MAFHDYEINQQRMDRAEAEFARMRAERAVTTNERLVAELQADGCDEDFIAEAEQQMLDAMDELGCS